MKEVFDSPRAPIAVGAYPHAVKAGPFLFLSGVGPRQKDSDVIPGQDPHDIAKQTQAVIDNVKMILQDSGSSLEQVIDVQVFLTNMKRDFQGFNEVYKKIFESIQATRTTVEVGSLPTPIAVEFKVIAMVG